jgi:hypothetical protein
MQDLIQFYDAHYLVIWAVTWLVLSALFNVLTRFKTPEQWVEFGEKHPRVQNIIRLMRALGIDPVKAIKALGAFLAGKSTSTQPDRPPILKDVKTDKEH